MSFDFDAAVTAPFRMQPGLRRLGPGAPHLTPAGPGSRHQREKLAVLSAFAEEALVARPGFDPLPALRELAAQATAEHPGVLRWDGTHAQALGVRTALDGQALDVLEPGVFGLGDEIGRCLRGLPPAWRFAGLLSLAFREDFAIVDGRDATLPWMAVALPSHWAPEEKVGRHFTQVHAPVADNAQLLAAGERLAALVCGPERFERFVWNVSTQPRLHAHPRRSAREDWPAPGPAHAQRLAAAAWWRTERQTFIPLPQARQAVFTILVDVQPLAQAIDRPARARALHDALATMSPAVLAYRGLEPARDGLLPWLLERAGR